MNILSNVGEAAGQSVKHFHVHVIPRYAHETGGFQITMKSNNTKGWDLLRIATSIKEEF